MQMKKYILKSHPVGEPKVSDFELVTEEVPALKDGEILLESVFLSVDPYMRYKASMIPQGGVMPGQVVARVADSKNAAYKKGVHVLASCGWQSHVVGDPEKMKSSFDDSKDRLTILPDMGGVSPSLALGVLGMPGITALYGLIDLTQPKAGETLVVSGAAGAVGSVVGQIGKILGMKVIGFAGADDKVAWLKDELGFDYAYNYKTTTVAKALKESAPDGVDVYFDNVGGQIAYDVMLRMKQFGRVSCCGAIASYNDLGVPSKPPLAPAVQIPIISNQLSCHGFIVTRWMNKWQEGVLQLLGYVKQGKLKYKETVTDGFEKMPNAFIELLRGANTGKAIVKA
ncbi:prostaglandin reductase 1-like [Nesidiocoris tenuis]|uniref:Prostaglandin reductase 1 n=1 Tax=Nesidiocoris tenuis TaxID=355587 RepID=A0ABN7B9F0_9HEMI|nr:prostaglandin reductase 1-like [Nesidiocoris tenuis]